MTWYYILKNRYDIYIFFKKMFMAFLKKKNWLKDILIKYHNKKLKKKRKKIITKSLKEAYYY